MPTIPITSDEQYEKTVEVLLRVGGWFHGVGKEKRFLIVNQAQYEALVEAGLVKLDGAGEGKRGAKKKKGA